MTTHTLTALYSDHATAERAAERLRAIGVPEASLEIHPEAAGDMPAGGAGRASSTSSTRSCRATASGSVEGARHRPRRDAGAGRRSAAEARSILREEAVEVEDDARRRH